MALAASASASVSLQVRAGKALSFDVQAFDESVPQVEANLGAYEGRLQIRDLRGRRRVLVDSRETTEPYTVLQRVGPGRWTVFIGRSYTSWLPMICLVEIDMQNKFVADDVQPLMSATLNITPEAVANS